MIEMMSDALTIKGKHIYTKFSLLIGPNDGVLYEVT